MRTWASRAAWPGHLCGSDNSALYYQAQARGQLCRQYTWFYINLKHCPVWRIKGIWSLCLNAFGTFKGLLLMTGYTAVLNVHMVDDLDEAAAVHTPSIIL